MVKGTIKTILGFIVLGGGATVLVGSLNPLGGMFEHAFNIQGIIPNNEAIVSIAPKIWRFHRAHYGLRDGGEYYCCALYPPEIHLPHRASHLLHGMHDWRDPDGCRLRGVGLVFTGSLILGLIMAFFPAIAQRYMKRITGNDEIAFGHFGTLGYVLSGWIGSKVGKGSRSTEEMNLPKNLSFLRDSSISIS